MNRNSVVRTSFLLALLFTLASSTVFAQSEGIGTLPVKRTSCHKVLGFVTLYGELSDAAEITLPVSPCADVLGTGPAKFVTVNSPDDGMTLGFLPVYASSAGTYYVSAAVGLSAAGTVAYTGIDEGIGTLPYYASIDEGIGSLPFFVLDN